MFDIIEKSAKNIKNIITFLNCITSFINKRNYKSRWDKLKTSNYNLDKIYFLNSIEKI